MGSVSDDLNGAADYLEEHGWCRGDLWLNGRVCLIGALHASCNNLILAGHDTTPAKQERVEEAHSVLKDFLGMGVVTWNDDDERTKEEVIQALRDAATKNQPDSMRQCPGGGGA